MKYIIIPTVKFIWAIIVTFFLCVFAIVSSIFDIIWYFKLTKSMPFDTVEQSSRYAENIFSPYAETPKRGQGSNYYKTYFHYIWGIKTDKRNL